MSLIASSKRLIVGAGPTGQAVARHFQDLGIQFEVADTRQSDLIKNGLRERFSRGGHLFWSAESRLSGSV
jgi:hypothetical protein